MAYLTHLNALQAVESAVRNGSLTVAAEELGITPAAVGQRIRALENYLGVVLLERGRHSFAPSPALKKALPELIQGFERLAAAGDMLQLEVGHTIRLSADPDWAALWLFPRLEDFAAEFPQIGVQVNGFEGAADFSVTMGGASSRAGAEELFTDYWLPVVSKDVRRRIDGFPSARQLEGMPLLHFEPFGDVVRGLDWPEWVRRFGHRLTGADRGFRYRRLTQGVDAARSDVGFLLVGMSSVQADLEAGKLTVPFAIEEGAWLDAPYVLRTRTGALVRPQARRFHDWLVAEAGITRRWLQARVEGAPEA